MAHENKSTKLYVAGRNSFFVLVALILLTIWLEYVFGCQGECDQNGFEGLGYIFVVIPAIIITFGVSVLSLVFFILDRYPRNGSKGIYRKKGVLFMLSILSGYILALSSLL